MSFASVLGLSVLLLTHLISPWLLQHSHRAGWLAPVAGGVSVSYVFLQLLPKLTYSDHLLTETARQMAARWQHHGFLLALIGLILFLGLDRSSRQHTSWIRVQRAHLLLGIYSLYNFIIGYLLPAHYALGGTRSTFLFSLAMALHFFLIHHLLAPSFSAGNTRIAQISFAAFCLLGWMSATLLPINWVFLALLLSILAGAMILLTLKEEIQEESLQRFGLFILGAAGYTLLVMRI
ncbi:hypothetical protein V6U78_08555 [Marinospirillum sp. MEB164]|uniref:ZIP Zinc transporter n=1 Tax=Marinospirillum alkalitolerans TaxID=3123374 RepID=A0ABW8PXS2_9GAMM